ncbi:MAG: O-antigen ligase family protein [Rhodospirillales bacterium]|nr:O-antigen ligase family protein [Rhodospirillales bacterium]
MIGKTSNAYPLAGAALVIPTFGLLFPLGLAPLLAIVALIVLAVARGRVVPMIAGLGPFAFLLLLLSLWGAASSLWSIIPGHSLFEGARLLLLSLEGLIIVAAARDLDDAGRAMVGRAAVIGLLVGLVIMTVELVGDFPIRRLLGGKSLVVLPFYDRGATVLSLASWVTVLRLLETGRRGAAVVVFALTAIVVWQLMSLSAFLAMLVALVVFALGWWRARLTAWLLGGAFVLIAAIIPFLAPGRDTVLWLRNTLPGLRGSATHRLIIWNFTSERWHERPLLGWGMDASRAVPGGKTMIGDYMNLPPEWGLVGAVMPLHPHDAVLQWWLELGVVGAILGTVIALYTLWKVAAAPGLSRNARAIGLAVFATALLPLLLNFGVWQSWWESSLWLIAGLLIAVMMRPEPSRP